MTGAVDVLSLTPFARALGPVKSVIIAKWTWITAHGTKAPKDFLLNNEVVVEPGIPTLVRSKHHRANRGYHTNC